MTKIYTLNEAGQHQVRSFVQNHGKDGLKFEEFFADAERAANDGFDRGLCCTLEIGRQYSETGNPQVLTLEESWFDADEVDADA